mmetsp:Transcript_26217/g.58742  ORF Transcript_26217/g.58742 Transcript_26217/m.58742 type:complete len:262 (-) Transcript_26217:246-1031(-)
MEVRTRLGSRSLLRSPREGEARLLPPFQPLALHSTTKFLHQLRVLLPVDDVRLARPVQQPRDLRLHPASAVVGPVQHRGPPSLPPDPEHGGLLPPRLAVDLDRDAAAEDDPGLPALAEPHRPPEPDAYLAQVERAPDGDDLDETVLAAVGEVARRGIRPDHGVGRRRRQHGVVAVPVEAGEVVRVLAGAVVVAGEDPELAREVAAGAAAAVPPLRLLEVALAVPPPPPPLRPFPPPPRAPQRHAAGVGVDVEEDDPLRVRG